MAPRDPGLYWDLAPTWVSRGEFDAARDLERRGLEVAPEDPELLATSRNLAGR